MQIDWFTTFAQVLNFLVLVAILKFLLFDRIVAAVDSRRERIESEREKAQRARREAEKERERARELRSEVEETREAELRDAHDYADERRKSLESEVREEVERMRERFRATLRDQERQLVSELVGVAARGATAAAERALEDLADAKLFERVLQRFCMRLRHLDKEEAQGLADAWGSLDEPLVVRSSRELGERQRKEISRAMHHAIPSSAGAREESLTVQVTDELACGIELSGAGHAVGWSIRSYLGQLENRLEDALSEEARRESDVAEREASLAETGAGDAGSSGKDAAGGGCARAGEQSEEAGDEEHAHAQP